MFTRCGSWSMGLGSMGVAMLAVFALLAGGCASSQKNTEDWHATQNLRGTSITVYPVVVASEGGLGYDTAEAKRLGGFLQDRLAMVVATPGTGPEFEPRWVDAPKPADQVQATLLTYWASHPLSTQYAMVTVYSGVAVGGATGINSFIVDNTGSTVRMVRLNRARNPELSSATPKTAAECTDVLLGVLDKRLQLAAQATTEDTKKK